jgi:membrane-associated phospholipid phosphatase
MKKLCIIPVDLLSSGFIALNLLAILISWQSMGDPFPLFVSYAAILLAIPILAALDPRVPSAGPLQPRDIAARRIFEFFRLGYPLLTMVFVYLTTYRFQHIFFSRMLDPHFAAADQLIFGYQPSQIWMEILDNYWVSEILHGAYFLYFVLLGLVPFYLLFKSRKHLNEYTFAAMTVFYANVLTYLVLPVAGGRFDPEVMAMTETLRHGPFTRLMANIYSGTDHFGSAFPSTHASMSIVLAAGAFRYRIPGRIFIAVNGVLVAIAAVYCGYHYFVDIIAGAIYAAIFYPVGLGWYRRLGRAIGSHMPISLPTPPAGRTDAMRQSP